MNIVDNQDASFFMHSEDMSFQIRSAGGKIFTFLTFVRFDGCVSFIYAILSSVYMSLQNHKFRIYISLSHFFRLVLLIFMLFCVYFGV